MTKHTQEPWRVGTFGGQLEVIHDSAKSICSVCPVNGLANARLIAAAPDLLAALKAIIYPDTDRSIEFDSSREFYIALLEGGELDRAQAAIAKAEQGES